MKVGIYSNVNQEGICRKLKNIMKTFKNRPDMGIGIFPVKWYCRT